VFQRQRQKKEREEEEVITRIAAKLDLKFKLTQK
jgi:hypothetical protein